MEVGEEGCKQVHFHRHLVLDIQSDNNSVRGPADDKHAEDDKQRSRRTEGFFPSLLHAFRVVGVDAVDVDLGPVYVAEDEDVTETHEEERRANKSDRDDHSVGETGCTIPDALVVFLVKYMTAPPDVVWKLEQEGHYPCEDTHDYTCRARVDLVVDVSVTDEGVTVDADEGETEEGAEASREAGSSY